MSEVSSTVSGGESSVVNLSELNFTQLDQLRNQVQQVSFACGVNKREYAEIQVCSDSDVVELCDVVHCRISLSGESWLRVWCLAGLWISELGFFPALLRPNAPINVTPHLPQVGQKVGICWGLVTRTCPRVGAFATRISILFHTDVISGMISRGFVIW